MTEARRVVLHRADRVQGLHRPIDHATVSGAGLRESERTEENGQVTTSGEITFSDFLNLFVFNTKYNVGALIKALQSTGFFQSLAEPNLIAYNGQEASFLAGGEIPVPVVQGTRAAVSVEYKEFGDPPDLHADDRGRRDSPEGAARGEHARFRQRHHAVRVFEFLRCQPGGRRPRSSFATASRS